MAENGIPGYLLGLDVDVESVLDKYNHRLNSVYPLDAQERGERLS